MTAAADTIERLRPLVARSFGRHVDDVSASSAFADLGGDSLDLSELELDAEDEFRFRFAGIDGFHDCPTVQEAAAKVDRLVAARRDPVVL